MAQNMPLAGLIGAGTDIIEIDRIKQAIERGGDSFLKEFLAPGKGIFVRLEGIGFPVMQLVLQPRKQF